MRFLMTVVLFFGLLNIEAQIDPYLAQAKAIKYEKVKKSGNLFCAIGGGLIIAGAILLSDANHAVTTSTHGGQVHQYNYGRARTGTICIIGGVAGFGTGITLTIIGGRKSKYYRNISISMRPSLKLRTASVISLTFKLN